MNQILSTEDPNKKKTKQKMNSPEFNKIVKVFAIAIFIFGAALIPVASRHRPLHLSPNTTFQNGSSFLPY